MEYKINKYEKRILEASYSRWQTINEISKRSEIHWNTVKKYIIKLVEKGWILNKDKHYLLNN